MANPTQTTLSAAITASQTAFAVASATGLSAPTSGYNQKIYVLDPGATKGELMSVLSVSGTTITVSRLDEFKGPHLSGAIVLIQNVDATLPPYFVERDPVTVPESVPTQTSILNVTNGNQWLYSTVTKSWVPGWNNVSAPPSVTASLASGTSAIAPSGPLFHITGSNTANIGITRPTGFTSGSFTIIPDTVFTWTVGDGSIALAGTAVVSKALTFTYDWNAALWYPSYVA